MAVDWSEFKDGDRVRVVFEGTYQSRVTGRRLDLEEDVSFTEGGWLEFATAAELIERPFKAPEAGKLFRTRNCLWMSLGEDEGFILLKQEGDPIRDSTKRLWSNATDRFRESIEVVDGV